MKTFEYRVYPNKSESQLLMNCLRESRGIYNQMVELSRADYEANTKVFSLYGIQSRFSGKATEHVPATTVQMLAAKHDAMADKHRALSSQHIAQAKLQAIDGRAQPVMGDFGGITIPIKGMAKVKRL